MAISRIIGAAFCNPKLTRSSWLRAPSQVRVNDPSAMAAFNPSTGL
jgi:hypothetical protein